MFAKSVLGFYALPIWTALWLYIAYPALVSTKPVATSKHWFTIIGGSCYKYTFCRDKIILFVSTSFVATNICRDKHNFVATNVLSQQAYFCRDKHVSRQIQYCRDNLKKKSFVATKVCLSRQTRVCRDKYLLRQNLCGNRSFYIIILSQQSFVEASIILSRQKMVLVAAPSNDSLRHPSFNWRKVPESDARSVGSCRPRTGQDN